MFSTHCLHVGMFYIRSISRDSIHIISNENTFSQYLAWKNSKWYGKTNITPYHFVLTIQWRHNESDCISNQQPHGCLFNGLFRRISTKTWKFRGTGLCSGNLAGTVNSPHKWPVTRKVFPFDDVIMAAICRCRKTLDIWGTVVKWKLRSHLL